MSDQLQVAYASFTVTYKLIKNNNKKTRHNIIDYWWIYKIVKYNTDTGLNLLNDMQFDENILHFKYLTRMFSKNVEVFNKPKNSKIVKQGTKMKTAVGVKIRLANTDW